MRKSFCEILLYLFNELYDYTEGHELDITLAAIYEGDDR